MSRKSPVRVQQWVDSISIPATDQSKSTTNSAVVCNSPQRFNRGPFTRDFSFQSDESSRCSSIESMLELRKPDPEAVLIGLGFGPSNVSSSLSRIPQRFLGPSKLLTNLDIAKFIEQQQTDPQFYEQKCSSTPASPARPRPSM